MTTSTNTNPERTIFAVTCPGDPHEERPAYYAVSTEAKAIQAYADDYRGGDTTGVVADEADMHGLLAEAGNAGDALMVADIELAMDGDREAAHRVCLALLP